MRGKTQLFFLIIGMLLYILDLASDVFLAVQYYRDDESKWFAITLSFIIITVVIINITTCIHVDSLEGPGMWLWVFCSGWPILFRYVQEFTHWKYANLDKHPCGEDSRNCTCEKCKSYLEQKKRWVKSTYSLAWLHLIQTLTQSAPQLCLQAYIMLSQWDFPCYKVLAVGLSLASLTWSVTALEKARETKNDIPDQFKPGSIVVFLIWQLFALISRLFAIVVFAYVFRYHVISILAVHWFVSTVVIAVNRKEEFRGESVGVWCGMLITSWISVFPLMVFASESLLAFYKNRRLSTVIASIVLAFENVSMLVLSVTISVFGVERHLELLRPVAVACVVGGLALGIVSCVGYYKCCCRNKIEETQDVASTENNGFRKEEC